MMSTSISEYGLSALVPCVVRNSEEKWRWHFTHLRASHAITFDGMGKFPISDDLGVLIGILCPMCLWSEVTVNKWRTTNLSISLRLLTMWHFVRFPSVHYRTNDFFLLIFRLSSYGTESGDSGKCAFLPLIGVSPVGTLTTPSDVDSVILNPVHR